MKTAVENPEHVAQTQLDNRLAKAKPVKLGWSTPEIEEITSTLNTLLANYSVHYQKLRNYHWNVTGSDFFDFHMEFESQYVEASDHLDKIAERVRIFGKNPLSTLKEYLETSEIKESSSQLSAELMVRELLSDYRILLEHMVATVAVATRIQDAGTEEMTKKFIYDIEKHHWMLSAYMAK